MKQVVVALTLILISISTSSFSQKIVSIYAGAVIPVGKNTEMYEVGYTIGFGYEAVPIKNLGLALNMGYSYIYAETETLPFFGAWIDNEMGYLEFSPRLIIPNSSENFRFYVGPGFNCTYIYTLSDIYEGFPVYNEYDDKDHNIVLSLNAVTGIDYFIGDKLGIGANINYQAFNILEGGTSFSMDKSGLDNNEVDFRALNINLKLSLKF